MVNAVHGSSASVGVRDVVGSFVVASYFRFGRKVLREEESASGTPTQMEHLACSVMIHTRQCALQLRAATQRTGCYVDFLHSDSLRTGSVLPTRRVTLHLNLVQNYK